VVEGVDLPPPPLQPSSLFSALLFHSP
jgi:hypothetical protein